MSNDGYVNSGVQGAGPLTVDLMQRPFGIKLGGEQGTQKGVMTESFWLSPPWGRPRAINYPLLEKYEKNEWIQMVTTHIIDSVVQCEYSIKSIDEDKIVQSDIDEVTEFFKAKKWQESWKETLRRLLPDLLLYDAGTIIKVFPKHAYDENMQLIKSEDGKSEIKARELKKNIAPVELVARDGRSFLKDCDLYGYTKGFFQYAWIAPHAKPIAFDKDEIIYMQMRPQSRSPYGTAPLETVMNIVDYLTASVNANRKYWENGIFIGGQIDHPDVNDIDEMQKRAEMYQQELKGEENYNKWLITFGGTKITPLSFTNQQQQWLETSEFFGRIVFAIFKVTPSELGFTDGMNHATADIQSKVYKSKGVQNILDLLEEYINREIIWKHFNTDIEFKFDRSLDLEDLQKQTNVDHQQLQDGVTTVNSIRVRDGDEPFDDELFDQPYAEMTFQDNLMSQGEEGEEGEYEEEEDPEMSRDNAIGIDDMKDEEVPEE